MINKSIANMFFFFFQAEDGIRDLIVTGVQTCALPIYSGHVAHPYRYVDWSGRPPHGLVAELGEVIGDAAQAVQAGLAELLPRGIPGRHGVVFSDGDKASSADN